MTDLPDKVPGPHDNTVQCIVRRDKTKSQFKLYLDVGPPAAMEEGKFILAARKVPRATGNDYIISSNADDDMCRGNSTYIVGKLSSNFLNNDFKIYHTQPPRNGAVSSANDIFGWRKNYKVAHDTVVYKRRSLQSPLSIQCTLHTVTASAMDLNGSAPTPTKVSASLSNADDSVPLSGWLSSKQSKSAVPCCSVMNLEPVTGGLLSMNEPLVLKSVMPRWHPQKKTWSSNFKGRVTLSSQRNFQLVAGTEPNQTPPCSKDGNNIILQFGRIGNDNFTVDYRYPLSYFQAFAIFLSSVDSKP